MSKQLKQSPRLSAMPVYKYTTKKKKKKRSRSLKGFERLVNRMAKAEEAFASKYRKEHDKSTRKKKDGWLRDLGDNLYKADKAARKKLKLRRIVRF